MRHFYDFANGFVLVLLITLGSLYIASLEPIARYHISPLIIGVVLGILASSLYRNSQQSCEKGVTLSAKKLLRLGIILYGFRVSLDGIMSVGLSGTLISLSVVVGILVLGSVIGVKVFKLDKELALLVSGGSAICGAAAVLALESSIKSQPYKGIIAVGSVVVFGLISMFLYPLVYAISTLGLSEIQWGVYVGATLHEVANVVGAGSGISPEVEKTAIIIKMIRVLLLIPVLLIVPLLFASTQSGTKRNLHIPWFAFGFLGVVVLNSVFALPAWLLSSGELASTFLLVMAMSALGLQIDFKKFLDSGGKAFGLAFVLALILIFGGYGLVYMFV
ncbi:YeiH family protein [uncultured Helicobacter sp.]|uniref:YeiH family protein n=1 Tax=uncultured Helicobacter sp. TaxID=175537 RepID=UPI00374EA3C3